MSFANTQLKQGVNGKVTNIEVLIAESVLQILDMRFIGWLVAHKVLSETSKWPILTWIDFVFS
jgi:hypothetical protein